MKLEHLNIIHNYLTAVFHIPNEGWQYTIVLQDGSLFQPNNLYQSSQKAYQVAKNIIDLVVACDQEYSSSNK